MDSSSTDASHDRASSEYRSRTVHNSNLFNERCKPSAAPWDALTWTLPGSLDQARVSSLWKHIQQHSMEQRKYPNGKVGWMWKIPSKDCMVDVRYDFIAYGYDQYGSKNSSKVHPCVLTLACTSRLQLVFSTFSALHLQTVSPFSALIQRSHTLVLHKDLLEKFSLLRGIVDEARGAALSVLDLDAESWWPTAFVVRQGTVARGGTDFIAHQDDDVDENFKITIVIKLTEAASSFNIVGAPQPANYAEGAGRFHAFPSGMWHEVKETQFAVKLTLHFAGAWKFAMHDVRRMSASGRVQLGSQRLHLGKRPPEAPASSPTHSYALPFKDAKEGILHLEKYRYNHYAMFGLSPGCGVQAVRKVFLEGSKLLHPDKIPAGAPINRQEATAAFQRWKEFANMLSATEERRATCRGGTTHQASFVEKAMPATRQAPGCSTSSSACRDTHTYERYTRSGQQQTSAPANSSPSNKRQRAAAPKSRSSSQQAGSKAQQPDAQHDPHRQGRSRKRRLQEDMDVDENVLSLEV